MEAARVLKLTYEDYRELPQDGRRYEILDGDLFGTPAPSTKHQDAVLNLAAELRSYARRGKSGRVFVAPFDVVLSEVDIVQPDVCWVGASHLDRVTDANLQGRPDLLIEVLSPTSRRTDEIIKRKRYEQFQVPEYWLVDPEAETVRIYRLERGRYERAQTLEAARGDALRSALLPGFVMLVAALFEV